MKLKNIKLFNQTKKHTYMYIKQVSIKDNNISVQIILIEISFTAMKKTCSSAKIAN